MVDDDVAALELRKLVLERCGHVVTSVADIVAAREALYGSTFDVVITDLRLPEAAEGLALIREIHEISGPKIVVLCGDAADIQGREEASMVSAILQKPVRSEVLLHAIDA